MGDLEAESSRFSWRVVATYTRWMKNYRIASPGTVMRNAGVTYAMVTIVVMTREAVINTKRMLFGS